MSNSVDPGSINKSESRKVDDEKNQPVALITGAAGGIGNGIIKTLASAGWRLLMIDLVKPAKEAVRDIDDSHSWYCVDIGDPEDVKQFFNVAIQQEHRCPDLLVNNAATQIWSPLIDLEPEDWERVIRTNLTGTFLMSKYFAKSCIAHNQPGNIINIGSGCNQLAFPNLAPYVASKGGIEMFTRAAALELGKHDIRVNCIAPGAVATPRTNAETEDYAKTWSALTPLGRVGFPEDVANAILLLSDKKSSYITGQTLGVDGGLFSQAIWPQQY